MPKIILAALVSAMLCGSAFAASPSISPAEARKRLADKNHAATVAGFDRFVAMTQFMDETTARSVAEAYLALGIVKPREPMKFVDMSGEAQSILPLHRLLQVSCGLDGAPAIAQVLLEAGADINARDPLRDDGSPILVSAGCPGMVAELLKWKPDLTMKDKNGTTVLERAFIMGDGQEIDEVVFLLAGAGYDVRKEKKFVREHLTEHPGLRPLLEGSKGRGTTVTPPSPVDWKALPPYAARSAEEAKRMLAPPGNSSTVDEHFSNALGWREPQRLALSITAGANVRQLRTGTGFTPLVFLTSRCTINEEAERQVALAEMLIAAGADLLAKDSSGANALILAAGNCPTGVVRALLKAGVPADSKTPNGVTPLKNAIGEGRADVVGLLLDAGVDPKKEPYNVKALASGNKEIEALLKRRKSR